MNKKIERYFKLFKDRASTFESKKILLMLSGGVDSMVLAHFLLKVKDEFNIEMACFHLNHMYRGKDADSDAQFARDFCLKNGLKNYIEKRDIPTIAKERKLGFEHCAREVRLGLARQIKEELNFDLIATAHHLDDSVESIVHNFIRGASLQGLVGMDFVNGYFIRPLIDLKKSEILEIAEYFNIEYREDATNLDTDFTRNLIRHNILPEMLKINSNFKNTLINSAGQIREDKAYLENQTIEAINKIRIVEDVSNYKSMDIINLDLIAFRALNTTIKKRIIRYIIEEVKGDLIDVYSSVVDEILSLSNNVNSGKHIIFKDIIFEVSRDKFVIASDIKDKLAFLNLKLGINQFNKANIELRVINYEEALAYKNKNKNAFIILPSIYLEQGLILRRRRAGDYIYPARLKGKKKSVKKLFVDLKLSRVEKDRQVLLCKEDQVLWVAGLEKVDTVDLLSENKNENFVLLELLNL